MHADSLEIGSYMWTPKLFRNHWVFIMLQNYTSDLIELETGSNTFENIYGYTTSRLQYSNLYHSHYVDKKKKLKASRYRYTYLLLNHFATIKKWMDEFTFLFFWGENWRPSAYLVIRSISGILKYYGGVFTLFKLYGGTSMKVHGAIVSRSRRFEQMALWIYRLFVFLTEICLHAIILPFWKPLTT